MKVKCPALKYNMKDYCLRRTSTSLELVNKITGDVKVIYRN